MTGALGFFVPGGPPAIADLTARLNNHLPGRQPAIVQDFFGWWASAPVPFPQDFCDYAAGIQAVPMLTWQPGQAITGAQNVSVLNWIRNGTTRHMHDDNAQPTVNHYIGTWADAAKACGYKIYIRLAHEMNGNWYPWGRGGDNQTAQANTNTPSQYVDMFTHVVGIFRAHGATNVEFVWCPSADIAAKHPVQAYYPGDPYVDWVGLDGYNNDVHTWRFFPDIYQPAYTQVIGGGNNNWPVLTTKPIMVCEIASIEATTQGADPATMKARWILNTFLASIPDNHDRIRAVLYFDATGQDRHPDYVLDGDSWPLSFAAFQQVWNDAGWQDRLATKIEHGDFLPWDASVAWDTAEWRWDGTPGAGVPSTGFFFTPPTDLEVPNVEATTSGPTYRLFRYYQPEARGRNIFKLVGGRFTELQPTDNDMVDIWYLGGRTYTLSAQEAADLTAAGYEVQTR